jgi:hypothetical protein
MDDKYRQRLCAPNRHQPAGRNELDHAHQSPRRRRSDSKIGTIKQHLAQAIIKFMRPEILQEIQRLPAWKNSILATRERMACKYERCVR